MASDPRHFNFDDPPRYESGVYAYLVLSVLTMGAGAIQGALLCYATRRGSMALAVGRASDLLTLNLMVANTTFCSVQTVLAAIKVHGRSYKLGFKMCQVEGFFLAATAMWAMSAAMLLAFDRYFAIVKERTLPARTWYLVMAWTGVAISLIKTLPLMLGMPFVVQPSGLYCEQHFSGQQLTDRAVNALTILIHLSAVVVMMCAYNAIYNKVRYTVRSLRDALQNINTLNRRVFDESGALPQSPPAIRLPSPTDDAFSDVSSIQQEAPEEKPSFSFRKFSVTSRKPPARSAAVRQSEQVERATFVKSLTISIVAFWAWVPYTTSMTAAALNAPATALFWLDCISIAFVALRCHAEGHIVALLDPVPHQAICDILTRFRAMLRHGR
ncbi:hypothetical protein RI367_008396 [Sorochytrium milnesiophthora]